MTISSPAFTDQGFIPDRYTALGPNLSPPLVFSGAPAAAHSLVLVVQDIDAAPQPWTHWLVVNIPPSVMAVSEGTIPDAATEALANGGTPGYEGPNQIYFSGTHQYQFRLYAVDTDLGLSAVTDWAQLEPALDGHVLSMATVTGLATGSITEAA